LTGLARETADPAMEEAMGTDVRGGGGHELKSEGRLGKGGSLYACIGRIDATG
jgi:hypothetical protein